jgi:hypothetical protein
MRDDRLGADAAQALRGAHELIAAGRVLAELQRGAGASVAAASAGQPWGRDGVGLAFERQYRPVERQILLAWEQLAAYMESLGEAAARSVHDHVGAEASERISSAYREQP